MSLPCDSFELIGSRTDTQHKSHTSITYPSISREYSKKSLHSNISTKSLNQQSNHRNNQSRSNNDTFEASVTDLLHYKTSINENDRHTFLTGVQLDEVVDTLNNNDTSPPQSHPNITKPAITQKSKLNTRKQQRQHAHTLTTQPLIQSLIQALNANTIDEYIEIIQHNSRVHKLCKILRYTMIDIRESYNNVYSELTARLLLNSDELNMTNIWFQPLNESELVNQFVDKQQELVDLTQSEQVQLYIPKNRTTSNISYREQGNIHMYTLTSMLQRQLNKYNIQLINTAKLYWDVCSKHKHAIKRVVQSDVTQSSNDEAAFGMIIQVDTVDVNETDTTDHDTMIQYYIEQTEYINILTLIYYVLVDCNANISDQHKHELQLQWHTEFIAESTTELGMSFIQLYKCLYNLADIWTFTTDVNEYIKFLQYLFDTITTTKPNTTERIWKSLPFEFDLSVIGYTELYHTLTSDEQQILELKQQEELAAAAAQAESDLHKRHAIHASGQFFNSITPQRIIRQNSTSTLAPVNKLVKPLHDINTLYNDTNSTNSELYRNSTLQQRQQQRQQNSQLNTPYRSRSNSSQSQPDDQQSIEQQLQHLNNVPKLSDDSAANTPVRTDSPAEHNQLSNDMQHDLTASHRHLINKHSSLSDIEPAEFAADLTAATASGNSNTNISDDDIISDTTATTNRPANQNSNTLRQPQRTSYTGLSTPPSDAASDEYEQYEDDAGLIKWRRRAKTRPSTNDQTSYESVDSLSRRSTMNNNITLNILPSSPSSSTLSTNRIRQPIRAPMIDHIDDLLQKHKIVEVLQLNSISNDQYDDTLSFHELLNVAHRLQERAAQTAADAVQRQRAGEFATALQLIDQQYIPVTSQQHENQQNESNQLSDNGDDTQVEYTTQFDILDVENDQIMNSHTADTQSLTDDVICVSSEPIQLIDVDPLANERIAATLSRLDALSPTRAQQHTTYAGNIAVIMRDKTASIKRADRRLRVIENHNNNTNEHQLLSRPSIILQHDLSRLHTSQTQSPQIHSISGATGSERPISSNGIPIMHDVPEFDPYAFFHIHDINKPSTAQQSINENTSTEALSIKSITMTDKQVYNIKPVNNMNDERYIATADSTELPEWAQSTIDTLSPANMNRKIDRSRPTTDTTLLPLLSTRTESSQSKRLSTQNSTTTQSIPCTPQLTRQHNPLLSEHSVEVAEHPPRSLDHVKPATRINILNTNTLDTDLLNNKPKPFKSNKSPINKSNDSNTIQTHTLRAHQQLNDISPNDNHKANTNRKPSTPQPINGIDEYTTQYYTTKSSRHHKSTHPQQSLLDQLTDSNPTAYIKSTKQLSTHLPLYQPREKQPYNRPQPRGNDILINETEYSSNNTQRANNSRRRTNTNIVLNEVLINDQIDQHSNMQYNRPIGIRHMLHGDRDRDIIVNEQPTRSYSNHAPTHRPSRITQRHINRSMDSNDTTNYVQNSTDQMPVAIKRIEPLSPRQSQSTILRPDPTAADYASNWYTRNKAYVRASLNTVPEVQLITYTQPAHTSIHEEPTQSEFSGISTSKPIGTHLDSTIDPLKSNRIIAPAANQRRTTLREEKLTHATMHNSVLSAWNQHDSHISKQPDQQQNNQNVQPIVIPLGRNQKPAGESLRTTVVSDHKHDRYNVDTPYKLSELLSDKPNTQQNINIISIGNKTIDQPPKHIQLNTTESIESSDSTLHYHDIHVPFQVHGLSDLSSSAQPTSANTTHQLQQSNDRISNQPAQPMITIKPFTLPNNQSALINTTPDNQVQSTNLSRPSNQPTLHIHDLTVPSLDIRPISTISTSTTQSIQPTIVPHPVGQSVPSSNHTVDILTVDDGITTKSLQPNQRPIDIYSDSDDDIPNAAHDLKHEVMQLLAIKSCHTKPNTRLYKSTYHTNKHNNIRTNNVLGHVSSLPNLLHITSAIHPARNTRLHKYNIHMNTSSNYNSIDSRYNAVLAEPLSINGNRMLQGNNPILRLPSISANYNNMIQRKYSQNSNNINMFDSAFVVKRLGLPHTTYSADDMMYNRINDENKLPYDKYYRYTNRQHNTYKQIRPSLFSMVVTNRSPTRPIYIKTLQHKYTAEQTEYKTQTHNQADKLNYINIV